MRCDLKLVHRALNLLADGAAECWIFGGWAEELHGLCSPRRHQDLDLLCVDQNFAVLERLIEVHQLDELEQKRFPHKRAFVLDGVMVEVFLVERDGRGPFTNFWGHHRHDWPGDLLSWVDGLPVACVVALTGYRSAHPTLQRARGWQTPRPQASA